VMARQGAIVIEPSDRRQRTAIMDKVALTARYTKGYLIDKYLVAPFPQVRQA